MNNISAPTDEKGAIEQGTGFNPFYEKIADRICPGPVGKLVIICFAGLLLLLPRYAFVDASILADYSWLLILIIVMALFCLYAATYSLHSMLAEMNSRVSVSDRSDYLDPLNDTLTTRNLILVGSGFGVVNVIMAVVFGLTNVLFVEKIVFYWGYFIAGFICGMAVFGIYGVSVCVSALADEAKDTFDFTAPDKCGGTHFIGDALLIFSVVTLIIGVLISIYIMKAPWEARHSDLVLVLKSCWIVFPYLMSVCVLVLPATALNRALQNYQVVKGLELKRISTDIRRKIQDDQTPAGEKNSLRDEYAFQESLRVQLYTMRTWPFSLNINMRFLGVLLTNAAITFSQAHEWVNENFPDI